MDSPTPQFARDGKVQYRSDRSKVGEVIGEPVEAQAVFWYKIRLFTGAVETVPEEDLEPFQAAQDPRGLFVEGRFGGPEDLIRKATFHKLNEPLQNTLYSLGASRTDFYAHQFKPLLKFIDSDDQKLLIADEVGLGKTIEAGLILVELRARRQLGQLLITCPAALVHKWRNEMWNRFDEDFQVLNSKDFRDLIGAYRDRGELGDLRAIISLQSLRQRGNRELIEATPLPLDLLIVDEAHHLRNPGTLSHRTVDALAVGASAIVFLTATPIHLGSDNLFHLLRILNPGEFADLSSFNERLEANEPIVEAERLIRISPIPIDEIRNRLDRAGKGSHSGFFLGNPFFERAQRLVKRPNLTPGDQLALEANLKDLNLLSHILTRSRKREVLEKEAVRQAAVVSKEPTGEEMDFYQAVTDFVRGLHGEGTGSLFAAITAQRQVASSMQAARNQFRAKALEALGDPESSDLDSDTWTEPLGDDDEQTLSLPERVLLTADRLGEVDTKFDALLEQLRALEAEEPGRKMLVFSYFKATLRYLERRLGDEGLRCIRIDGDVDTDPTDPEKDERGRRMRAFRDDPSIQILLSSEVGSEGLDFQFCHILINYDLPWNPARVEQRIGRLDRLGQTSDRIIIYNLSLPGTIEHRILNRLYERIGIFRKSLGDLEAILGEEIEKLTRFLLSRHLTPEEEEERIEEAANVVERRKKDLDRLEKEGDRFVGRDSYFDEKLERARAGGEVLAGGDIRMFLQQFLERNYPDSELKRFKDENAFTLFVDEKLERVLRAMHDPRSIRLRFLQRIMRGRGEVAVTFDSKLAFQDDTMEFLAPHHPLLTLAVQHYQTHPEELHPTSLVGIGGEAGLDPGAYVFLLYQVTTHTGREQHRLEPFLVNARSGLPVDRHTASLAFGRMLRDGGPAEIEDWDAGAAESLLEELETAFTIRLAEDRQQTVERQEARVNTRLRTLESSFKRKVERKRELLDDARTEGKDPRYLRLLEGTIRNLEADFEQRSREIEAERHVRLSSELVATGVLQVEA